MEASQTALSPKTILEKERAQPAGAVRGADSKLGGGNAILHFRSLASEPETQPRDESRFAGVFARRPRQIFRFTELARPFDADVRGELAPHLVP